MVLQLNVHSKCLFLKQGSFDMELLCHHLLLLSAAYLSINEPQLPSCPSSPSLSSGACFWNMSFIVYLFIQLYPLH